LKYKWIKKNVNLNNLTDSIEHFLNNEKFNTLRENFDSSNRILGSHRRPDGRFRSLIVVVSGTPDNFTVELKDGQQMQSILKLSSLISFFGGGPLLLRYHQSAEFYQRIKLKFWKYVEKKVAELVGSAESPS